MSKISQDKFAHRTQHLGRPKFIHLRVWRASGGLPAASGLHSSLGPGTGYLHASFLGLSHGKPAETCPPSAKLPQPRVYLVSVASFPAFRLGCISGPVLESAGFEMAQMVWYRGGGVAVKEQGEKGHSTQSIGRGHEVGHGS
jgi:hypothetical protein